MITTPLSPSDLKTVLHSKRANFYYLEHCRVLLNGGRVEYLTEQRGETSYWNIPIANTTCILLGTGTSITQAAVRELARAGVMLGFCGGDGTPLYAACEIEYLSPQSEYRPTQYLQRWCAFWYDDAKRLLAAKALQQARLKQIARYWPQHDWHINENKLENLLGEYQETFTNAADNTALLTAEGRLTHALYDLANRATLRDPDFHRNHNQHDNINRFLNHGNYLAYGLGATACWVLGLPHGLAVLHGKTRRGGLVFDAADIIKDAFILPQAFLAAQAGDRAQDYRSRCITTLARYDALDHIIETLQTLSET